MSAKLDLIQVARYCRYKPGTIRTYCTTKHFPHHVENDKVVFYIDEVNDWLINNKRN